MRLKQLQDFLAVVDAGSIHAAARRNGVSQPAITKSVRSLEAELHVQLLRRTNHGIVPTSAGRAFFARMRVAQSEMQKALDEIAELGDGAARPVAFGIGPTAGTLIAAGAITEFRQHHPTVRLRILEALPSTLLPLVRDETLDFAIGARPDGKLDPSLFFKPLFRHEFAIVARKGHVLRRARSLTELKEADWLALSPFSLPGGPLERLFLEQKLPRPRIMIECESYNVAIAVMRRTDMLGIISLRLLATPLARDALEQIAVTEQLPSYAAGIFTRKDTSLTRPAASMARAISTAARRLTGPS